jgi:hypothetical protein
VLSNFEHTRFGNSPAGRSSFSNSRFGLSPSRFETPAFGRRHQFGGGESFFGQESSFGGDAFSIIPDLLGLALTIGSFGSRGFGLLGLGLDLLGSSFGGSADSGGFGSFGGTPAPVSPYWGPGMIYYPPANLICPR